MADTLENEAENIIISSTESFEEILLKDYNGILKEIPFLSTVCSIYKIGRTVSEIYHLKQLYAFIEGIRNSTALRTDKEKYINKLKEYDVRTRNRELEYIVLITSKYINDGKPKLLAKLYVAFLEEKCTWDEFMAFSEILDRFLPGDVETLEKGNHDKVRNEDASASLIRLSSMGIFYSQQEDSFVDNYPGILHISTNTIKNYNLTDFGAKMRFCLGFDKV